MSTREVFNPATGERFWFSDETNDAAGRVRSLRYELLPGNAVPVHYHPGHAQRFEVLAGQLHTRNGTTGPSRYSRSSTTSRRSISSHSLRTWQRSVNVANSRPAAHPRIH